MDGHASLPRRGHGRVPRRLWRQQRQQSSTDRNGDEDADTAADRHTDAQRVTYDHGHAARYADANAAADPDEYLLHAGHADPRPNL